MATSITPDLQRFILRFVRGDAHRARDLVQDTLLAAWRHLPELRQPQLLRAWLYRVAYRNTISSLRRRGPRGRPMVTLDAGPVTLIENRPARDEPYWRVAGDWSDSDEITPQLRSTLAELPPRYALALRLHYIESLTLRQTALVLGVPVPTLKMRLHRARQLLRRLLTAAEGARRFRSAPGHRGASIGRPPPPPVPVPNGIVPHGPPSPVPPSPEHPIRPTAGIALVAPVIDTTSGVA